MLHIYGLGLCVSVQLCTHLPSPGTGAKDHNLHHSLYPMHCETLERLDVVRNGWAPASAALITLFHSSKAYPLHARIFRCAISKVTSQFYVKMNSSSSFENATSEICVQHWRAFCYNTTQILPCLYTVMYLVSCLVRDQQMDIIWFWSSRRVMPLGSTRCGLGNDDLPPLSPIP